MRERSSSIETVLVALCLVGLALLEGGYPAAATAAIAIVAWAAVLLGFAFGELPRGRIPAPAAATAGLLGGLLALTTLSTAWASDAGLAVKDAVRLSAYLGVFALALCCTGERSAGAWLRGLAFGILAVAVLALVSRLVVGFPGGDEEIVRFLPAAQGRLSYPIGYWNGLGALVACGVLLFAWIGASARSLVARAGAVAAIPALGLVMYLTISRGSFVTLAAGAIVLVAVGPSRLTLAANLLLGGSGAALLIPLVSTQQDLRDAVDSAEAGEQALELAAALLASAVFVFVIRMVVDGSVTSARLRAGSRRSIVAAGLGVLVAAAVVADPIDRFREFKEFDEPAATEQAEGVSLARGSGSGRWQFWGEAIDAFREEPVHGIGAGAYRSYWDRNAPIRQVSASAHSVFLEALAELGAAGLLLWAALIVAIPLSVLMRWDGPRPPEAGAAVSVIAAGVTSAAIDWVWEIPVVIAPILVALALLTGPALTGAVRREPGGGRAGRVPRRRPGWRFATIVVGCACVVLAADSLFTERRLEESRQQAVSGDLEAAADEARSAISLQPWSAAPRLQLALVEQSRGRYADAFAYATEAIERAEDDWVPWLVRARIARLAGRISIAESDLNRARELNPMGDVFTAEPGPLQPASSVPPVARPGAPQ